VSEQAKITRRIREERTYERTVEGLTLDMSKGQTNAEPTTVTVRQLLGDLERFEDGKPRVILNVKRTTRGGLPTYKGQRTYNLNLVDVDRSTVKWGDVLDFTEGTVDGLRELRARVLAEWDEIDWDEAGV